MPAKIHCWTLCSQMGAAAANVPYLSLLVHFLAGSTADPLLDTHPKSPHSTQIAGVL